MVGKRLLPAVLLMATFAANAHSSAQAAPPVPAAPRLTAEQQRQNQQMQQAALQVAQMVDQDKVAQIWDGASAVVKQIISRDAFVRGVDADRRTVGAPLARSLASLTYSQSDGKNLPAGLFVNVAFLTRFANEKQPVRELVSFHLDSDHVWRVTGYTVR